MVDTTNTEIRSFYEQARALEPTDVEVMGAVQRVARAATRRGRGSLKLRGAAVLAFAVVVLASAFTYPPARDALDAFFSGGAIPGTQADLGSFPPWLTSNSPLPSAHPAAGSERLVAQQDGQHLYAYRDSNSGRACLVFGNDSDTCSSSDEWQQLFSGHALLKLASGVGPTSDNKVAVFGLARSSISSVALLDGNTTVAEAPVTNGGWVIVAPQGTHDTLVGLAPNGKVVESLDARTWTWHFCFRESGCK